MVRKKRIRELKRPNKDFPICGEYIDKSGLVPHIVRDANGMYWSGLTAIDGCGRIVDGLSDSQRKQMLTMILGGYYGEEIKDALVDDASYWRVRDLLITSPNQERILKESLGAVKVARVI